MKQSNFKYIADHNCSFYIVCIALCFIFSITIPFCFLFKESFLVHFSDNAALLGYFWPSNSTSSIAAQPLVSFLQNSFFVIEIWASQPGTETTTLITEKNCALAYRGGWWYSACHDANPNGLYQGGSIAQGITWAPFRRQDYSLKHIEIKLRPAWFYLKKLHVQASFAKW